MFLSIKRRVIKSFPFTDHVTSLSLSTNPICWVCHRQVIKKHTQFTEKNAFVVLCIIMSMNTHISWEFIIFIFLIWSCDFYSLPQPIQSAEPVVVGWSGVAGRVHGVFRHEARHALRAVWTHRHLLSVLAARQEVPHLQGVCAVQDKGQYLNWFEPVWSRLNQFLHWHVHVLALHVDQPLKKLKYMYILQ